MLDLSQLLADIGAMGKIARERGAKTQDQLAQAIEQARKVGETWPELRERIDAARDVAWIVAGCTSERLDQTHPPCAPPPARYSILATDGSQIPFDRHAVVPCYLINVGKIALHYGGGERPILASQATLHFKDDEIYDGDAADPTPLSEKSIANRRLVAESAALAELIAGNAGRWAVAMVDGPLIVWLSSDESKAESSRIVQDFEKMLESGRVNGVPVAGYISRPGHKDVVGALRVTLCDTGCKHKAGSACSALAGLTDAQLFTALLTEAGSRSSFFRSMSKTLKLYSQDHQIAFFYVNTGYEIARVEIPAWVAEDAALRERVHSVCVDQSKKGQGFPICLAEAHERAVVRGADRAAFDHLVENELVRQQLPVLNSRKALTKRTRIV